MSECIYGFCARKRRNILPYCDRSVKDLPEEDEVEIPTLVMLRILLLVAWIGSHSETDLAQSIDLAYTNENKGLCDQCLTSLNLVDCS